MDRARLLASQPPSFCRVLFVTRVMASMARATLTPSAPRAIGTANAPAKNAPKNGM
jgi:hypothetical protein